MQMSPACSANLAVLKACERSGPEDLTILLLILGMEEATSGPSSHSDDQGLKHQGSA